MTQTLGSKIKKLRTDNNNSVAELADYLGTSMKVIYNIEGGLSKPSAVMLVKIAKKYKVDVEQLVEGIK